MSTKLDHAAEVADRLDEFLAELCLEDAYNPEAIICGAHAAIVALMVRAFGGQGAAESCERAAERVRHLPSLAAAQLVCAQPAGTVWPWPRGSFPKVLYAVRRSARLQPVQTITMS